MSATPIHRHTGAPAYFRFKHNKGQSALGDAGG